MATTASALTIEMARKTMEAQTNITFLKELIDFSKKSPAGVYSLVRDRLEEIKTSWNQFKGSVRMEHRNFQTVDLQIASTEKKVAKLLTKDLSQSLPPIEQIKQRAGARGYIVFSDTKSDPLTACFANYYPCKIEFSGRVYQNAESVFQAQKFKDQPDIMSKFEQTDGSTARQLASQYKMSPSLRQEWENNLNGKALETMSHVLFAKFKQNHEFLEKLMATGKALFVKHSTEINPRELFWGDGSDGQGKDELGACLVELRGKCGGSGTIADYKPDELKMFYQTYPGQAPANASPQTQNEDVAAAQQQYQDVYNQEREKYLSNLKGDCKQQ